LAEEIARQAASRRLWPQRVGRVAGAAWWTRALTIRRLCDGTLRYPRQRASRDAEEQSARPALGAKRWELSPHVEVIDAVSAPIKAENVLAGVCAA
jgi:hypothetical protein